MEYIYIYIYSIVCRGRPMTGFARLDLAWCLKIDYINMSQTFTWTQILLPGCFLAADTLWVQLQHRSQGRRGLGKEADEADVRGFPKGVVSCWDPQQRGALRTHSQAPPPPHTHTHTRGWLAGKPKGNRGFVGLHVSCSNTKFDQTFLNHCSLRSPALFPSIEFSKLDR